MSSSSSNVVPFVASATMPMVTPEEGRLVQMLDAGASYREIFHALLRQEELVGSVQADKLADRELLLTVMHCIDRDLLRDILTKTVGFRHWQGINRPSSRDPGAYVVAPAIYGRRGRFLTREEMRRLLEDLQVYIKSAEVWHRKLSDDVAGGNLTVEEKRDMKVAKQIDSMHHQPTDQNADSVHPSLRHAETPTQVASLRACADMLQGWVDALVDNEGDPIQQAPLMVGNAGKVDSRMLQHEMTGGGHSTPRAWAVTVSCLKYRGLIVEAVGVPVTRAWALEQVNAGEVLVTMLAASMTDLRGFNVKQPGTWAPKNLRHEAFHEAKLNVFVRSKAMKENLACTSDYLKRLEAEKAKEVVLPPGLHAQWLEYKAAKEMEKVELAKLAAVLADYQRAYQFLNEVEEWVTMVEAEVEAYKQRKGST